jgi:pyruvate dehydrogenase complex dehydrogenase (E1) component
MGEVVDGQYQKYVVEGGAYIREHMIDPTAGSEDPRTQAGEELVAIVHAYLT